MLGCTPRLTTSSGPGRQRLRQPSRAGRTVSSASPNLLTIMRWTPASGSIKARRSANNPQRPRLSAGAADALAGRREHLRRRRRLPALREGGRLNGRTAKRNGSRRRRVGCLSFQRPVGASRVPALRRAHRGLGLSGDVAAGPPASRPVASMSAQAAVWSEAGATNRFGDVGRPEELQVLATNLDTLLDRLAAALRQERLRTAELSHELRTPLALIVAELEWLRWLSATALNGRPHTRRCCWPLSACRASAKRCCRLRWAAASATPGRSLISQ